MIIEDAIEKLQKIAKKHPGITVRVEGENTAYDLSDIALENEDDNKVVKLY